MAPLACTLALLAMTVATAATEEVSLDMAPNSFDDQYLGCRSAMMGELKTLNRSEFQQNPLFADGWAVATAKWRSWGSPIFPLSSSAQAIALMAYTRNDVYKKFNAAVREAGRSSREYRENFHFKTLHFLLTDALATLRVTQKQETSCVYRGVDNVVFKAQKGDTVRFGQFTSTSRCKRIAKGFGMDTTFWVETAEGVDIRNFSYYPPEEEVLIPPFETFRVTNVTKKGNKVEIKLISTGTHSNYNCEWLKGGTIPSDTPVLPAAFVPTGGTIIRDTPVLGGLLLATAALGVATGIF